MAFKDIAGQDRPIARLQEILKSGNLSGAYLFSGPQGVGKRITANNFARALNCPDGRADACDICLSCRKIESGRHPDIHTIDKGDAEEIKIEDIRILQQEICLRPYEAKFKVFIINDAHNLNPESSNAFLKTLEEPPKRSVIILVSDKPRLIFRTIISRCQNVRFPALAADDFDRALKSAYLGDERALPFLRSFCEGRIGEALNWKDRDIISFKNRIIDIFAPAQALSDEDPIIEDKQSFRQALTILGGWFRDIYLIKAGVDKGRIINLDRIDILEKISGAYSFGELESVLKGISDSMLYMEQNVNVKLLLANLRLSVRKN